MLFKKKKNNSLNDPRQARQIQRGGASSSSRPVFSYHARAQRENMRNVRQPNKRFWERPPTTKQPTASLASSLHDGSDQVKTKHRWYVRPLVYLVVVAAVVFGAVSLYVNRAHPQVVALEGAPHSHIFLQDMSVYQQAAQRIFTSSLMNADKLTINTTKIVQTLRSEFPELTFVSVALPVFGHEPVVYIQAAQPAVLLHENDGSLFVLDANGRALVDALKTPDATALGLPTVDDQSGLPVTIGRTALPAQYISFITEVTGQLSAKKVVVTSLVLPKDTSELDVRVKDEPYAVKFNLHGEAREEAGSYLAVRQYLQSNHITPASYVDVRVVNRAYYR